MTVKRLHVTAAELAILEFLWEHGPAEKRGLVQALYPSATNSDRATVQKLLERLENKQLVTRDRRSPSHVFTPTLTREAFAGRELESLVKRFAGGSLSSLVMQLVESKQLSARERRKIRDILDEADRRNR